MKPNHVSSRIYRANLKACPYKIKLSMEDAPAYLLKAQKDPERYHDPENLELYVCAACSWLHIGHQKAKT